MGSYPNGQPLVRQLAHVANDVRLSLSWMIVEPIMLQKVPGIDSEL